MKIHLLSDIHLETGPYKIPDDLECDVIVAAGDISNGIQGVEFLKTLNKPVVYVLGNHEYWSHKDKPVDMFDTIANVRTAAAGSNVHFLENDAVVIDGVRFLGATLWTNFGELNPCMIDEAARWMNDYRNISCQKIYANPEMLALFYKTADAYLYKLGRAKDEDGDFKAKLHAQYVDTGRFHPFVAYIWHQESVNWINEQMSFDYKKAYLGKTVVVTHHHPSYESLRRAGVEESWLQKGATFRVGYREPNGELNRVAAYASELSYLQRRATKKDRTPYFQINTWLCGHLHHHMDYMHNGMRIVCNPRGRTMPPLTTESAADLALWVGHITPEEIEASQQRHKENPYEGDGYQFDRYFIVDLSKGLIPVIAQEITDLVPKLTQLHKEILAFVPHVDSQVPAIAEAIWEAIYQRANIFSTKAADFVKIISVNLGRKPVTINEGKTWLSDRSFIDKYPDFGKTVESPAAEAASMVAAQKRLLQQLTALPGELEKSMRKADKDVAGGLRE